MLLGSLLACALATSSEGLETSREVPAPRIGVQLEVGAPDGLAATLSVMPAPTLRLQVAGLNNGIGSGIRFGAVLVAFPRAAFRPLLGVEAGYVFGGPGAWVLPLIPDEVLRGTLRGANVGFVNTQVGFELGSQHVALVLRGGLSWVQVTPNDQEVSMGTGATLRLTGVTLSGFIPSARIGLLVSFG